MIRLAGVVLTALLLTTASARADTISVGVYPDATEEISFALTANWAATSNPSPQVFLTVKPSGPLGCAASYGADSANARTVFWKTSQPATGSLSGNYLATDPGSYTACAYLQLDEKAATPYAASGPFVFTVRPPRASIALAPQSGVDKGQPSALSIAVTAEIARTVYVTRRPAGGAPCAATRSLEAASSEGLVTSGVQGTQTLARTISGPPNRGRYLLCAYVQEDENDPTPEAVGSTEYYVGPDPCPGAKRSVTRATREVRTAERATTRYRVSSKRYARRAARTNGAERRRLQRLAKRDRSRYHSAVRQRAKARTALTRARARVEADC